MIWARRSLSAQAAGLLLLATTAKGAAIDSQQQPLAPAADVAPAHVSTSFFAGLERLARLVDISYCIGNTGVSEPFNCVSRCDEFPTVSLVTTWNTGILMSDSCGYVAVDTGERRNDTGPDVRDDMGSKAIIVAFRGTYSITNTVVDLSTTPQKYTSYPSPDNGGGEPPEKPSHKCTNCTVHSGFLQSWKTTREHVVPQLVRLREQHPGYPIHLVGHSLGGAVACLAALELKVSMGWDDVTVTTFGEPRVGNAEFARFVDVVFSLDGDKDLEKRAYRRVTHVNDPVPLLPLDEWGYEQHAGEVFISKGSLSPTEADLHNCVGYDDPSCSAGADSYARYRLWELFFSHRDYFWRLGLCVPGGDPANWGRQPYEFENEL